MTKQKKVLMNFKIDEEVKKEIELASNTSGLSMTSIILRGAIKEAKSVLREFEKQK